MNEEQQVTGIEIKVKFGAIEIVIKDDTTNIESFPTLKDCLKFIRTATKSASDQVIAIQKSLHG